MRGPAGIEELGRLLQHTSKENLLTRLREIERRYRLACPKCGYEFWAEAKLIRTSLFDGTVKGFRCPKKGCDAIVPWERTQ